MGLQKKLEVLFTFILIHDAALLGASIRRLNATQSVLRKSSVGQK